MSDVLMREVLCQHCGRKTRHLPSSLGRIIRLQSVSSMGTVWINYACPECNRLTRSRLETAPRIFKDVDLSKFPDDMNVYIVDLECGRIDCEAPVVVLAAVKQEIKERALLNFIHGHWHRRGALCARGHAPLFPFEVRKFERLEPGAEHERAAHR